MRTKNQLINVALVCTVLLPLLFLPKFYDRFVNLISNDYAKPALYLMLIRQVVPIGIFAWGVVDLLKLKKSDKEWRGVRVLRVIYLLQLIVAPFFVVGMAWFLMTSCDISFSTYSYVSDAIELLAVVIGFLALYRLYKLYLPVQLKVLKGDIPISRTARFSSLLIDAVAGYYFFYWVKNTVIMIFGGGNFMHFLMDVFHWPMYFVFAYLYFYVARKVYGQSVGEAVINNSVLDFNVAKLQSGEQSGPDDVLDDGFIKRF